jgi:hypothetical protein
MVDNSLFFENAVRDYLAGNRDWDSLHNLALKMEVENEVKFPPEIRRPLEELHLIFLAADSKDDPQFRADQQEIADLLVEADRLRSEAREFGSKVVAQREQTLEEEQNRNRRLEYLERRKKKNRK